MDRQLRGLTSVTRAVAPPPNAFDDEIFILVQTFGQAEGFPRCGSDAVSYLENARVWRCHQKHDKRKFSLKAGTIFEDSPLGLEKWLPVMWLLVNSKNGVSSWDVHRSIGVTKKTAWLMLQHGRLAMQGQTSGKLGGKVGVDETFIGGKARNMHASKMAEKIHGRGPEGKAILFGMVERGGKVIAGHVDTRKKKDFRKRSARTSSPARRSSAMS